MLNVLLQRGGGNWLPFLIMLIIFVALGKGTEYLAAFMKKRRQQKNTPDQHDDAGQHYTAD